MKLAYATLALAAFFSVALIPSCNDSSACFAGRKNAGELLPATQDALEGKAMSINTENNGLISFLFDEGNIIIQSQDIEHMQDIFNFYPLEAGDYEAANGGTSATLKVKLPAQTRSADTYGVTDGTTVTVTLLASGAASVNGESAISNGQVTMYGTEADGAELTGDDLQAWADLIFKGTLEIAETTNQ